MKAQIFSWHWQFYLGWRLIKTWEDRFLEVHLGFVTLEFGWMR